MKLSNRQKRKIITNVLATVGVGLIIGSTYWDGLESGIELKQKNGYKIFKPDGTVLPNNN
jgi:hypothetical protein